MRIRRRVGAGVRAGNLPLQRGERFPPLPASLKQVPTPNSRPADAELALADQAYLRIVEAIRNRNLQPGTRLRETTLSGWLQMSRTPIREATQRLESQGLLISKPGQGLVVAGVDSQWVTDLYVIREVLEGTAARLAAESASTADLLKLRELVRSESSHAVAPGRAAQNAQALHDLIGRCARNQFLLMSLNALREASALFGHDPASDQPRAKRAEREHAQIVEAIASRKPELAERLMRQHVRNAHQARRMRLFGKK